MWDPSKESHVPQLAFGSSDTLSIGGSTFPSRSELGRLVKRLRDGYSVDLSVLCVPCIPVYIDARLSSKYRFSFIDICMHYKRIFL